MVIERDGRALLGGSLIPGLQQGTDAAFCSADAGHKTNHTENGHDPESQTEAVLHPITQVQKQAEGEQNGQAELTHPEDQR